ncbi:hypothetical protein CR203_10885 [Salipaludibacillus neizhouensis]|uniref:Uncharacterized protein n=1 Tax=Salipaludibacillus neizhouensis TaxID=885475 RepID=A0A3A9K3V9_9BACI|nr:hypothetical protein CR203_10885 [Salipaludibacillus neizhouensis]
MPIFWTTDVNAAAYEEKIRGAAIDSTSCLYLTVGTGIWGGMIKFTRDLAIRKWGIF